MPKKTYLIVRDATHVLVGTGGQVRRWVDDPVQPGFQMVTRAGYHLPGGTFESGEAKGNALREMEEETGMVVPAAAVIGGFHLTAINPPDGVDFFVARVPNLNALVQGYAQPAIGNPNDEPFTGLVSLPIANAWNHPQFNTAAGTDWFRAGLEGASERDLLDMTGLV